MLLNNHYYEWLHKLNYKHILTNKIIKKAKNIIVYIDASQIRKKGVETGTGTAVVFTHGPVKDSKAKNVSSKIIITEAELQAISDAIAIYSKKAPKNSGIWLYTDSQMTL